MKHRNPVLGFCAALVLALCGLVAGARADAADPEVSSTQSTTCAAFYTSKSLTFRVVFHPRGDVKGKVQSVRSDRVFFTKKRNNTWVGTVTIQEPRVLPSFHFVTKSDAPLFSDRRFSRWYDCTIKGDPNAH